MKHVKISILTTVMVVFAISVNAQNIRKANKEFELHAFNLAIKSYQAILTENPDQTEAMYKLAESYRHLDQIDQAIPWYKKAINQKDVDPMAYYNYGLALMNNSEYDEAKIWFLKYAETNPYVGAHYAENCDYAKSLQGVPALYRVKKEYLNKPAADFGPAFFGDQVVYSSARSDLKRNDGKENENWTGSAKNQLFITSIDDNGFLKQPTFLRRDLKNNYNEGPVSYSGDGKWVVFTKNNFVNGTRQIPSSGIELSLYIAEVMGDGDWRDAKAFSFNGSGYSSGFAHLNHDGTKLYFASDRPDGYGGFDIYVTSKAGDLWSSPQNLGPVVNSPGNEITPFVENGLLYFASDWHQGLGGFDIFKAEYDKGSWNRIYHLGNAINSSSDDYGLIYNNKMNQGYFTSNRQGGKGNEDIYQFSQLFDNIVISVKNAMDNAPVENATVDFSACGEASFSTDSKGEYSFQALPGLNCEGVVFKNGYSSSTFTIHSDGRKQQQQIEIFLTRESDKFLGRIIDANDNSSIADVIVRATDQTDGSQLETTSNNSGEYKLALAPNTTYVIRYSKVGYTDTHQRISIGDGSNKSVLGIINLVASTTNLSSNSVINKSDPVKGELPENMPSEYSKSVRIETEATKPLNVATTSESGAPLEAAEFIKKGYAVQIAALGIDQNVKATDYAKLFETGNIYSRSEKGFKKIRVGVFESEEEAQSAKAAIVKAGYSSAFIISETLNDIDGLEIYSMAPQESMTTKSGAEAEKTSLMSISKSGSSANGEFMIRLAAYKNLQYFEAAKISDLGVIEQRKSGDFSVMYLTGFTSKEEASTALKKVATAGFSEAYLVENKNGNLVKVKM